MRKTKEVKKVYRFIFKFILGLILFMMVYLVAAWLLPKIVIDKVPGQNDDITIYVITNGVHTDVVVPTKTDEMDWSKEIKYENAKAVDSTYNYLAMGWGDTEFFLDLPTWDDLTTPMAIRAAIGLNTTAIHATYYKSAQLIPNDTCKKLSISYTKYKTLTDYIKNTFEFDEQGHVINIPTNANYGNTDAFYKAKGRYNMFRTCNTWTNSALKAGGQKACLWTAFDFGIMDLYP